MSVKDLVPWFFGKPRSTPAVGSEDPLSSLQHEVNKIFDQFVPSFIRDGSPFSEIHERISSFSPKVDVTDTESELVVRAELPGMSDKDVELNIREEGLVIRGEKKSVHEEKRDGRTYVESSFGKFERFVPLHHVQIVEDKIDASFKDGVLTVRLPKNPEAVKHGKKISVRAES